MVMQQDLQNVGDRQSVGHLLAEWLTSVFLCAANLLFVVLLGRWLLVTGVLAIALCGLQMILTIVPRPAERRLCANLLMVITVMNFNGWAFSHLSNLLVFLGLFFFVLFGLIMGATINRLLTQFAPLSKPVIVLLGMVFVLVSWWGALVLEASYYPGDALAFCNHHYRRLAPDVTYEQQREAVLAQATEHLKENYGSSGTLAYLRWGLASGEVSLTVPGRSTPAVFTLRQQRGWLWLRLAASLILLCFGVFSQLKRLDEVPAQTAAVKAGEGSVSLEQQTAETHGS